MEAKQSGPVQQPGVPDCILTDLETGAMRRFLAPLLDRIDSDGIRAPSHHTRPSLAQIIARASPSRGLLAGAVVILGGIVVFAAAATLEGINALPSTQQSVTGKLAATPGKEVRTVAFGVTVK
jgi:hypothetical protein